MKIGHTSHDYQTTQLLRGDDDKIWRERQACSECPWEIRYVKLEQTPEDEPPAAHQAPCWCPLCVNKRRGC